MSHGDACRAHEPLQSEEVLLSGHPRHGTEKSFQLKQQLALLQLPTMGRLPGRFHSRSFRDVCPKRVQLPMRKFILGINREATIDRHKSLGASHSASELQPDCPFQMGLMR